MRNILPQGPSSLMLAVLRASEFQLLGFHPLLESNHVGTKDIMSFAFLGWGEWEGGGFILGGGGGGSE